MIPAIKAAQGGKLNPGIGMNVRQRMSENHKINTTCLAVLGKFSNVAFINTNCTVIPKKLPGCKDSSYEQ
jgi:hypothetical protein